MENLTQYKDTDITKLIASSYIREGKAKDSGSIYYYIETTLKNGFKLRRIYLNNDSSFGVLDAIRQGIKHKPSKDYDDPDYDLDDDPLKPNTGMFD